MDRNWTAETIGYPCKNEHFRLRTQKTCVWSLYSSLAGGAPKVLNFRATIQAPDARFWAMERFRGEAPNAHIQARNAREIFVLA